jgi:hypothetical protein
MAWFPVARRQFKAGEFRVRVYGSPVSPVEPPSRKSGLASEEPIFAPTASDEKWHGMNGIPLFGELNRRSYSFFSSVFS